MKIEYHAYLHTLIVSQEKKAVGWGVPSDQSFKLEQAPYDFDLLIDGTVDTEHELYRVKGIPVFGVNKLKQLIPDDCVIIVLADVYRFGDEIVSQVSQIGDFSISLPFSPWLQENCASQISDFAKSLPRPLQSRAGTSKQRVIALVIYGFTRGGAEWQFVLLAKALLQDDHQVHIFYIDEAPASTQPWLDELHQLGAKLYSLRQADRQNNAIGVLPEIKPLLGFLSTSETRLVQSLYVLLRSLNADVCISYLLTANIIASLAARLAGVDDVLMSTRCSAPGTIENDFSSPRITHINRGTQRTLLSALICHAGVNIAANSQFGARSYERWLGLVDQQIPVVPNGLVKPDLQNKQALRRELGVAEESFLVLGVMRMVEQKRPQLFVQCIAELAIQYPNIRAVLIGDGELFGSTALLIEQLSLGQVVTMAGEKRNAQAYMQCADVVLQTSAFEGLPNVVLEAQLASCPVVCSHVGGTEEALAPEVVEHCLVRTDEVSEYTTKVEGFMNNSTVAHYQKSVEKHVNAMTLTQLANNTLAAARQGFNRTKEK